MTELLAFSGMIIIIISYGIFLLFIIIDMFFDTKLADSFLLIMLYSAIGGGLLSIFSCIAYLIIEVLIK